MRITDLVIIILLCGASAFLSASEIALFSLSRFQLREIKDRQRSVHRKIKALLADPAGLLIAILCANEVANITISSITAELVLAEWEHPDHSWKWLVALMPEGTPVWQLQTLASIIVTTPLILFFAELTPKVIAARINVVLAPIVVEPLGWVYRAMAPFRFLLLRGLSILPGAKKRGPPPFKGPHGKIPPGAKPRPTSSHSQSDRSRPLSEEEFLLLLEEGQREGNVQDSEAGMIRNVFALDDRNALDVMIPLKSVVTCKTGTTLAEALASVTRKIHSRIPVRSEDGSNILGVLYAKDLFQAKLNPALMSASVDSIMRTPQFFDQSIRLSQLFRRLKEVRTHLAIIRDAKGLPLGIVTMDDILGTLFEELFHGDLDEPVSRL
ncbi:MAG: CNNM domain-containing protein [Bdellovibrionota bacterium]